MDGKYKKTKSIGLAVLTVIVSLSFLSTGCGPSHEERQAKKEAERKELIQKNEEKEKRAIDQVANKHNAIYFPPKNLGATAFTYEFQEFFKSHSQEPLVFKGYLEDVEQTEKGIIVEFLSPLGEDFLVNKKAVRFRLTIPESFVDQFLKGKREDSDLHLFRYIYGPDYYVVAKIENMRSSCIYEFDGTANGEEVEIESDVSKNFVSTGQFIDAVAVPEELK